MTNRREVGWNDLEIHTSLFAKVKCVPDRVCDVRELRGLCSVSLSVSCRNEEGKSANNWDRSVVRRTHSGRNLYKALSVDAQVGEDLAPSKTALTACVS